MNTFFDFWCATSPRLRLICWGLWVIALCGLSRIALSPPVDNGRDAQSRLHQANLLQWRTLHKIAGSADEQRLVSDDNALPFSPFDFQQAEMQLVSWQPSAEGGELALKGPWSAIPPVFRQLAERQMRITQFTLDPDENGLRITLLLERLNDG